MLLASATLSIAISIGNEEAYELKTSVDPADAGSIILDPPGGLYKPGTVVTATAVANTNSVSQKAEYKFDHWSGDASGRSESVEILMDNDKSICAHFVKTNSDASPVAKHPPVADFEYEPAYPKVMEEVTFDASKSYDPDGGELKKYSWTYTKENDYSSVVNMGEGKIITYFWQNPGSYNVELYIEDDEGEHATIEKTIVVGTSSETPILAYEPNQFDFGEIKRGDEINGQFQVWNKGDGILAFTCTQQPDIEENSLNVQFNPDSGTSTGIDDRVTVEFSIETINAQPGQYEEEIIITSNGGKGDILLKITIIDSSNNKDPVADFSFTPSDPKIKETILFDASKSYDPDGGEIIDYSWSYTTEDPAHFPVYMGKGKELKYSWETPGKYYVTLTVIDDEENKGEIVKEVDVSDDDVYYSLELAIEPDGGGTVDLDPPGYEYLAETRVSLKATPNQGYKFYQWEGDITDTNPVVEIVMDSNKKIVAIFKPDSPPGKYKLNVDISPSHAGTVTLDPPGGVYEPNEIVTLTANANQGYKFDHWSGDVTGYDPSIDIKMDSDKYVTAVFEPSGGAGLTINIISPQYGCLYIGDKMIPLNTSKIMLPIILLSGVEINVVAENAVGNVTFDFYIDDELKHSETVSDSMASFTWDEKAFLRHSIRVVATDEGNNTDETSIDILIFNFG